MKFNDEYIKSSLEIKEFCRPFLESQNLTMFAYSRVFPDGSRSELWTDLKSLEHSFIDKKYIADIYTPSIYSEDEKYVYLPSKIESLKDKQIKLKYLNQISDQRNIFDNDNCFNIIRKSKELCEYFIFYTSKKFKDPVNFYLNKIPLFDKYIDDFKLKIEPNIQTADSNKIVKLKIPKPNYVHTENIDDTKILFSKREYQICKYIVNGKTAPETASYLGLSTRTIEKYIEQIKLKVGCNRKTELVIQLIKIGIF